MNAFSFVIGGIPAMAIIVGLVEFAKKFGLEGNACIALSMGLGVVLGVLYQLSIAVPVDLAGWLSVVVFGLGLGLAASGLYDATAGKSKA